MEYILDCRNVLRGTPSKPQKLYVFGIYTLGRVYTLATVRTRCYLRDDEEHPGDGEDEGRQPPDRSAGSCAEGGSCGLFQREARCSRAPAQLVAAPKLHTKIGCYSGCTHGCLWLRIRYCTLVAAHWWLHIRGCTLVAAH